MASPLPNDVSGTKAGWPSSAWLRALLIILAGCWVYSPVLHGGWLWDDHIYLPQNVLLHDPTRLWKLWFAPGSFIEYYPIEATVQYVQWQFWHNDTFGYHVTNIVLHLISALLIWKLLAKFGLRFAWLGGMIFAVHPIMVESVAWIAELKNTLSLAPFLLAICFFLDYEEHGRPRDYYLTLGFFLVAMLCKISMAPFPIVMLLYAWWKRGRIVWSNVRASLPFLLISLVLGVTTYLCGIWYRQLHPEPAEVVPMGGLLSRLACAGLSIIFYFSKSVWPAGLSFFYPMWTINPPSAIQFLPWLALGGIFALLWIKRANWGRHALLGLGFFLINLAPFIGLNAISYMRFTWVMNHFLYLPIIGLIGLAVAGLDQLHHRLSSRARLSGAVIVTILISLLAWESHSYAAVFVDEVSLWSHTIEHDPESWAAHNSLGTALQERGRLDEAKVQYEEAIRLNPNFAEPHGNLAAILLQTGHVPEAMGEFARAVQVSPDDPEAHYNLGNALFQIGQLPEAMQQYEQAVKINPNLAEAHYNLGNAYIQTNQIARAMEQYEQTLAINPDHQEAHANLGNVLLQMNRIPEAMEQYAEALQLDPNDVQTRDNLGLVLLHIDRPAEAKEQFAEALRLAPNDPTAQKNLARIDAMEKGISSQH